MTAQTVLLRVKRRGEQWLERPGIRGAARFFGCFGGCLVLSRLGIWDRPQPVAMGFAAACTGWPRLGAAAGGALGYVLFWGNHGIQGAVWMVGALLLGLLLPLTRKGVNGALYLAAGCMAVVSGAGLALGGQTDAASLFLRLGLAGGSVLLSASGMSGKHLLSRWLGWGAGVMALAQIHPALGWLCVGFGASAAPLPASLAIAMGAELGGAASVSLTAASALSFYLQRLLPRGIWRGLAAPGLACCILMLLQQRWEPGVLAAVCLGAWTGVLVPWHITATARKGSVGAAQVRLEQMARVFTRFQQQLLDLVPPPPDIPALTQKLRLNTCGSCSLRSDCVEQNRMTEALLTGDEGFQCRKSAQTEPELRRSREQLRRIRAARARQEEYRMALVQQYGFLSDTLRELSDHLPQGRRSKAPRCRVQVSARSRGKGAADGDRVSAFPGVGCRYYVLLCDGMGTGLGAAEESRRAAELIRQMLTAGMAPAAVLGSMNSQLTLMDRGGAVTVDLAELHLDTGRVWLYKWGAGPSWVLRGRRNIQVGSPGPPPGLGIGGQRESVNRVVLLPGDSLVLLSDGVDSGDGKAWAMMAKHAEPGELAARILSASASCDDDATAVVIRLLPHTAGA